MNTLQKQRMVGVLKYTWPFYVLSTILVAVLLTFLFGVTHRIPVHQSLTIFVSGEVTDSKKLEDDIMNKFSDKELKSFSTISANPEDAGYNTKLTVTGYNGADVLIIPESKLEKLVVSAFALDLRDELITTYYQGYTLFNQEDVNYGIKIDKEKVKDYMNLPNEDCYMILNGKSANTGEYSPTHIKEHNNALVVAKDWGM